MTTITLQQLQILIDRELQQDTQQYQPKFREDFKELKALELLDKKGNISLFGKEILISVKTKLKLNEERSSIFKEEKAFHPYKPGYIEPNKQLESAKGVVSDEAKDYTSL